MSTEPTVEEEVGMKFAAYTDGEKKEIAAYVRSREDRKVRQVITKILFQAGNDVSMVNPGANMYGYGVHEGASKYRNALERELGHLGKEVH